MNYAPDVLILAALILLAIGFGFVFGAAVGFFVAGGGCLALGVWIGFRGGSA